ncbi:MAG: tetratricopeptide repeat protein [Candidatus Loosdrechtia sp.]|uniref:tetratricopeptide repeat protein n=1 Tax=Candidatus Loosdrechtia sp. TaxID=3101272 RepID=UPI003A6BA5DA|nr:MAG: tetratricopeptide repeat protein [Candidatus Jettenia sp. AMX2]
MRISPILPLVLFLTLIHLGCSKGDAPPPNHGIVYTAGHMKDGQHAGEQHGPDDSPDIDLEQISNKLSAMSTIDIFRYALDSQNQGKYAVAMAAYNIVLERDENYPDIYYHQGVLYRDMGMRDEAFSAFQKAVLRNPNSAVAYYNLGYAYRCKGLHSEAVAEYKKALALVPENNARQRASIHYHMGFSYFASGLVDDAIREFSQALAYKPKDKAIHQKLGIAYTAKGWSDKAKIEFSYSDKK